MRGYWESDLIFGTNHCQLATLVERHTRYVILAKVNGKDAETVRAIELLRIDHKIYNNVLCRIFQKSPENENLSTMMR